MNRTSNIEYCFLNSEQRSGPVLLIRSSNMSLKSFQKVQLEIFDHKSCSYRRATVKRNTGRHRVTHRVLTVPHSAQEEEQEEEPFLKAFKTRLGHLDGL